MKYKLLCIDIDGTLLDDAKKIPKRVKESLKKASEQGIQIALITGRMPAAVGFLEEELGIACIKACNAGTHILWNGQRLGGAYLPVDTMKKIFREIAEKNGIPLWIFREDEWLVTSYDKRVEQEMELVSYQPRAVDVNLLAKQWEREGKQPNKLLVAADPDMIRKIWRNVKDRAWQEVAFACSADTFLEIFPKDMDKGKAIQIICQALGIRREETIAFGDQELDIPMMEAAGVGVAMGNAIKELKEKADFITKTNNEAGIAIALEQLLAK